MANVTSFIEVEMKKKAENSVAWRTAENQSSDETHEEILYLLHIIQILNLVANSWNTYF